MRLFFFCGELLAEDRERLREFGEREQLFVGRERVGTYRIEDAFACAETEDALPALAHRAHVPEPGLARLGVGLHQTRVERAEEHLPVEPAQACWAGELAVADDDYPAVIACAD